MFSGYINWNPDPSIFGLPFRWYGLLFGLSFVFAYVLFKRFFTLEKVPLYHLERLAIWLAVATVGGARLGHVFFYEPAEYLKNPIEILYIWQGGLASHGAAIGLILVAWWYARRSKWKPLWLLDRVVIPVALSGLFIRTGNFINQEILGKETTAPFGVVFQGEDQYDPVFTAGYKGKEAELSIVPETERWIGEAEVWNSPDSVDWRLITTLPIRQMGGQPLKVTDPAAPQSKSYYRVMDTPAFTDTLHTSDSLKPHLAFITHNMPRASAGINMLYSAGEMTVTFLTNSPLVSPVELWYKEADGKYTCVGKGPLVSGSVQFMHKPAASPAWYRLITRTDVLSEIPLFARHPSMLYEAIAYFAIFWLLLWVYRRYKGSVPHGLLFGMFMALIFTARFLIEFTKVELADYTLPVPVTVGQLLSLPFVIAGVFLWLRAMRVRNTSSPDPEPPKESKK